MNIVQVQVDKYDHFKYESSFCKLLANLHFVKSVVHILNVTQALIIHERTCFCFHEPRLLRQNKNYDPLGQIRNMCNIFVFYLHYQARVGSIIIVRGVSIRQCYPVLRIKVKCFKCKTNFGDIFHDF